MVAGSPPNPTPIYRLVHVDNLAWILQRGCLDAPNHTAPGAPPYHSIAHANSQGRRALRPITKGPGGVLHDYIPFYFNPRSPMLYANHMRNVAANPHGQGVIVILKSTVQLTAQNGCSFVFTDGHGVMAPLTTFYDDLAALPKVPWDVIARTYWHKGPGGVRDPDGSRKRQAEFMVHQSFPWDLVEDIGVLDQTLAARAQAHLAAAPATVHQPPVTIRRSWYF